MEFNEKKKVVFSLLFPSIFVAVLWLVKLVEWEFNLSFVQYGILPRDIVGLRGIFFSPFIHGSFSHLINNSIPLLILGSTLFYFYKDIAFRVTFWSFILAGLYTWISARTSYHIGASGLVYSLFGFILLSGFIRKNIHLISISFLVAFLYGSLIWGILPWDISMSWEGHFWGLILGIVLAFYYRKEGPQQKKFSWDIEPEIDAEQPVFGEYVDFEEEKTTDNSGDSKLKIVYEIKKEPNDKEN
ncbi:MAG: rhomboid family intramembrane serine protease [Bacteroidetes bacterium]|nr:MAG: rhomboid family intramembrane serine protease [Bacteroidota bacterium]MBL1144258.1 rhomboid family intramembrane serine protease [Bacteroidota bacterium]MCB0802579.1 rhomboid family intramembrane serine protease [Flavobacteriales bacterium]NOG57054.1 rhomboid family intramembrane serine protease [Bacteroidota bacterium]